MIHVPHNSCINSWITQFENTEIWQSWRVATALGMIGAVLGRNVAVGYGATGSIWPNTSVMLVGESGDGKDTILRPSGRLLEKLHVPYIYGKTMEAFRLSLHRCGNPAVGFLIAGELKDFIGTKDYQSGILQSITDILSNNDTVDITTKQDLVTGGARAIHNPTLTMFAASTRDWLQTIEGIMSGGFLPRFVLAVEGSKRDAGIKMIPNPGRYESVAQRDRITAAGARFESSLAEIQHRYVVEGPRTITNTLDGQYFYDNWYENRFRYFSPATQAYANRSGNLVQKIAMLMAISRGHPYMDVPDYEFAGALVVDAAHKLEQAVVQLPREVAAAHDTLRILPATLSEIISTLAVKHNPSYIKQGFLYLTDTEQAHWKGKTLHKT